MGSACLEGEQVSLMVKTTGRPTPTVTWLFNGRKVEDDYSTELGKDGSLVLVSVEMKPCWHLYLHCQQQGGQCGGMHQADGSLVCL